MADDYIGRRMEDLRSGRLASASGARHSGQRSGQPAGRLKGLRALVTGGAKGIGASIAATLHDAGCSVDIVDIDEKNGIATAQKHGLKFRHADISDPDSFGIVLKRILEERGDIDIIVNSAAAVDFVPLVDNSPERMLGSLKTNVVPILTSAIILARHRRDKSIVNPYGGRIINIASTRAFQSESGTENYSASKGGVISLTHSLMMSLSEFGITVNSISPGWILTDENADTSEADRLQHPSGRIGRTSDIAKACLFISLPGNDFLNGENITIDGGMTHKMIYI